MSRIHTLINLSKLNDLETLLKKDRSKVNEPYADPAHPEWKGVTPLVFAIGQVNFQAVKMLLSYGAVCGDLGADDSNFHPFVIAIVKLKMVSSESMVVDAQKIVKLLLAKINLSEVKNEFYIIKIMDTLSLFQIEAVVDLDPTNPAFLCYAARSGKVEMVEKLIRLGANVNAALLKGSVFVNQTPLVFSCVGGHVNVVATLIKNGAQVNYIARGSEKNPGTNFPLKEAASIGDYAIIARLLVAGADPDQTINSSDNVVVGALTAVMREPWTEDRLNILKILLNRSCYKDKPVDQIALSVLKMRNYALILAIQRNLIVMFDEILKHGVNVNLEQKLALVKNLKPEDIKNMVHFHLKGDMLGNDGDDLYIFPLLVVANIPHQQKIEFAEKLLKQGADVNLAVVQGRLKGNTPLFAACVKKDLLMIKFFLQHGASVDVPVNAGFYKQSTFLHVAVRDGDLALARILLPYTKNIDALDAEGKPVLFWAITLDSDEYPAKAELIRLLLEHGANVNLRVQLANSNFSIIEMVEELKDEPGYVEVFGVFSEFPAVVSKMKSLTQNVDAVISQYSIWSLPLSPAVLEPPVIFSAKVVSDYYAASCSQDILLYHAKFEMEEIKKNLQRQVVSFHALAIHILRAYEALLQWYDKGYGEVFCTRVEASNVRNMIMHLAYDLQLQELIDLANVILQTTFVLVKNKIESNNTSVAKDLADAGIYRKLINKLKNSNESQLTGGDIVALIQSELQGVQACRTVLDKEFKMFFFSDKADEAKMRLALLGQYYRLLKNKEGTFSLLMAAMDLSPAKEQQVRLFFERCKDIRRDIGHDFSKKKPVNQTKPATNADVYKLLVEAKELFASLPVPAATFVERPKR